MARSKLPSFFLGFIILIGSTAGESVNLTVNMKSLVWVLKAYLEPFRRALKTHG